MQYDKEEKNTYCPGSGYSLVELIVAISLGLFVATLIFTGYTGLFKGFRLQAQRAENIRAMVMARGAVDKATKNSEALVLHGPEKIVFIRRGSRAEHTLEFRDSSIIYDNRVIAEQVRSMEFDVSEKKSAHGFLLVCWEALLKRNAWVGGVIIMRDGKQ